MEDLGFEDFDTYLLQQKGNIIHQIWFDDILPNKRVTRKAFEKLRKYRDTWLLKNPNWIYICWNVNRAEELVKRHYPQHLEMYKKYPYPIQRCDAVRYFFLHRYGGLYADMDYHCNRSWDEVINNFPNDIYFVETPNKLSSGIHVSNSLMYSKPNHMFWNQLFIEMEMRKTAQIYYGQHMTVMLTTGPGIINRLFNKYKIRYKLDFYPSKYFHPYGISDDLITTGSKSDIYAIHLGKGSWETNDSKVLIFLYREWAIVLFIILFLALPNSIYNFLYKD